jgi:predicted phosphodiesterase
MPILHNKREYILTFGDEHCDVEFEIRGLFNEIINSYSPDIFESRMWDLFEQVVDFVKEKQLSKLHIFSMGDSNDGLLRVGQLWQLRYGVVEGTIYYANFISNWLNELSKYVTIDFQMVFGNHQELRLLNQPKGTFKKENMGFVVREIIEARLANNPNFRITKNPTGYIFANVCGINILGIHGEVKDLEKTIKDFSKIYNTKIDILIGGHLHHSRSEAVGIMSDVINVPSIMGVDDFALSLNKISHAGATIIGIEEGKGKVSEENIKLN